jgi:uncharacterized protein (TIGR03437 family)
MRIILGALALCVCLGTATLAQAQPVVYQGGVVNAASYIPVGLPNAGVARGAMFVAFGERMGPANLVRASTFPLPTANGLAGTSARITIGGTTYDCIMLYTSAGQIAGIIPSTVPAGTGSFTVTYNGQTSAPVNVQVVDHAFGIFARNQAGSGPGIVQFPTLANLPFNGLDHTAIPNDLVDIWGTGIGAVQGNEAGGPLPGNVAYNVEVLLGDRVIQPEYKGRSGCCAGIDQVRFRIPSDLTNITGCYVPLSLRVNGVVSNSTTIAIGQNRGFCSDPNGFSADDLARAATGNLRTGLITLNRTIMSMSMLGQNLNLTSDSGSGFFERYTFDQLQASQGQGTIGGCVVYTFREEDSGDYDPIEAAALDAGPQLSVTGPAGARTIGKAPGTNYYSEVWSTGGIPLPGVPSTDYLNPGAYTVSGPGGADVGPFSVQITIPQLLNWTNRDQITAVSRSQPLNITWSGGNANDLVMILGSSMAATPKVGAVFYCLARASAGQFTVPAHIVSALPPSGTEDGVPMGMVGVGSTSGNPARFTATGLDYGYLMYNTNALKIPVSFQ